MKEEIIRIAKEEKISEIGFCSAEDYLEREQGNAAEVLESMHSIITCAFGYYSGDAEGNISRYARGRDYHDVLLKKMSAITDFLEKKGYKARAYADIGKLDERLLAQMSGLAFRGRNQMAINSSLGSYFFIGYILTDCILSPDKENTQSCINCGMCVKACPLGALSGDSFNRELCLSHITQKKGELSTVEQAAMRRHNTAWGCDICQEVCPHNKGVPITEIEEFKNNLIFNLNINKEISNKEFKNMYSDRAFSWRGKAVLVRNQRILRGE